MTILESVSMVSMGESAASEVSLTVERGAVNVLLGPTVAMEPPCD
jgi:hypothetical protein